MGYENDHPYQGYQKVRRDFWDTMSSRVDTAAARFYHERVERVYRFLIPPGLRVIELGCGTGELLAAVKPSRGVGVDFSTESAAMARERHPHLEIIEADVHELELDEKFDVVIVSDLVNDIWDVQRLLENIAQLCHPGTRIVFNLFNRAWQLPIGVARSVGLAQPMLKQNWLSLTDMENLLRLGGFETISTGGEILWPLRTPLIGTSFNRFLVKLWPFNHLALTHFIVARPDPRTAGSAVPADASVSVVVPARNEAGHIREIIERVPKMGSRTELLFVEGNSTDDTYTVIEEATKELDDPDIRLYRQPGVGKGDAVRHGYAQATGNVLMILDADMTVAPEDLPRFFKVATVKFRRPDRYSPRWG